MKNKKNTQNPIDMDDRFKTSSASDCTGLITVPPENEDELENYMDIYDFGPPICERDNKYKKDM